MSAADKLQEFAKMLGAFACLAVQHNSGGGDGIMNPRRFERK